MSYLAKTTSKGHDYYKIMESYRDDKGVSRHRVLYNIGSRNELFDLLPKEIKNGKNHDAADEAAGNDAAVSQHNVEMEPVRCRIHGSVSLIYSAAEWLGVKDLMNRIFPKGTDHGIQRSESLILAAIHRACSPGSKSQFSNWFRYTSLPDYLKMNPDVFTSQHFWEQMDNITVKDIQKFETEIYQRILIHCPEVKNNLDRLSADFTNYYTYISNQNFRCSIAQLGHSKEGRKGQKIFNVAVVISPLLGIPIATLVYEGNFNDKKALPMFMAELKTRLQGIAELKRITFVFDGGGVSEGLLESLPGHFITRGSLKSSPELYNIPFTDYAECQLADGTSVSAYRATAKQYGKQRTVIVTLSDDLKNGQIAELNKQISKLNERIEEINLSLENPKARICKTKTAVDNLIQSILLSQFHFNEFIDIKYDVKEAPDPEFLKTYKKALKELPARERKTAADTGVNINGIVIRTEKDIPLADVVTKITATPNADKKEKVIQTYYGKHVITTDHDNWTTEKILELYRDQEFIERYFRDSKDTSHFSVRPAYHWTDQKLRVHVMLCYLGLSLCRFIQYLLCRDYGYRITCSELLERLEKVQECMIVMKIDSQAVRPFSVLSKLEPLEEKTWGIVSRLINRMKNSPVDYTAAP